MNGFWRELLIRFQEWSARQDWKAWLAGVPAVFAFMAWVPLLVFILYWKPARVEFRYRQTAEQALAAKNYPVARVACQRLLQTDSSERQKDVYNLGLSMAGMGKKYEAMALLSTLAPLTNHGYAPAHLFMAQAVMSEPNLSPDSLRIANLHLSHVLATDPKSADAFELLGRVHYLAGDWAGAQNFFLKAYATRKELALALARLAQIRQQPEEFKKWIEQATEWFQKETAAHPKDPAPRQGWVDAVLLAQQYPAAIEILESAQKVDDRKLYRQMAARVYAIWSLSITNQTPDDLSRRLDLIKLGLAKDPTDRILVQQVVGLSKRKDAIAEPAKAVLNQLATEKETKQATEFSIGIDAWQSKQYAESRAIFEKAHRENPKDLNVANNLAWLMAFSEPSDLEGALKLINSVLEQAPQQPQCRETRGQILVKMGRWQDALADLRFALPAHMNNEPTHTALAEAYRHVDKPELAAQHERMATMLRRAAEGGLPQGKSR